MNTYKVRDDNGNDAYVAADEYRTGPSGYLVFYASINGGAAKEIAVFRSWASVITMDEVESEDQNE